MCPLQVCWRFVQRAARVGGSQGWWLWCVISLLGATGFGLGATVFFLKLGQSGATLGGKNIPTQPHNLLAARSCLYNCYAVRSIFSEKSLIRYF